MFATSSKLNLSFPHFDSNFQTHEIDKVISTLETLKKEAAEVSRKVDETETVSSHSDW